MMENLLTYIICMIILISPVASQANSSLVTETTNGLSPPVWHLAIFEDKKKKLTVKDVVSPEYSRHFTRLSGKTPDFGFTSSAYWARFTVALQPGEWILEVLDPSLSRVSLYIPARDGSYSVSEAGTDLPYSSREIQSRNIAFRLSSIGPAPLTCYLRVESDSYKVRFPLVIRKAETFSRELITDWLIFGVFLGIVTAMLFYNLFLFFSLRECAYLLYVLMILSIGVFQTVMSGAAQWLIWPENTDFNRLVIILPCCGIFLGGPFVSRYLNTAGHAPRVHDILRWISRSGWLILASGILAYLKIVGIQVHLLLISTAYILLTLFILSAAFICIKKGYSPAKYAIIAFAAYMAGLLTVSFMLNGIIPGEYMSTITIQQATSALGMILLSLGLADRINVMRREQERDHQASLETELLYRDSQIRSQRLELELLKKTIQPHFVMNTLTAVRSWLIERPEKAVRLIDALADELRPVITNSNMKLIPLRDEINLCRSHLEVMGLRLDRQYELTVTGATGSETVPPLIFHTMLENAFTHGDPYLFTCFSLVKETLPEKTRFVFAVDSKEGTDNGGIHEGTGIRYIRTRLEESYPRRWDLACGQHGGEWRMIIEIQEAKE